MSHATIQKEVRQRDRFLCAYCRKRAGEVYAHIIPDRDRGRYALDNINFFCSLCDNQLEAARAKGGQRDALIRIMTEVREAPKSDDLLTQIFTFPAGADVIVALGNTIFKNNARILESVDHPDEPYLSLNVTKFGVLDINAYLEDESGNVFSRIQNSELTIHTGQAWDIIVKRRSLRLEHVSKTIRLDISQDENCTLHVTGRLYLNGGIYDITNSYIHENKYNFTFSNGYREYIGDGLSPGKGMTLSPGLFSF